MIATETPEAQSVDKSPLERETERAFDWLNATLFGGGLVQPVIRINYRKHPRIRFYGRGHESGPFDLVIGSGVRSGEVGDFLEDLIHEMVHVRNQLELLPDQTDCTSNQYHNLFFRDGALAAGLYVSRHKTRGWGITSFLPIADEEVRPDPERVKLRERAVIDLGFSEEIYREVQKQVNEQFRATDRNRKQFQYKYICRCPPPHNSVRCGRRPDGPRPLQAICLRCLERYTLEE